MRLPYYGALGNQASVHGIVARDLSAVASGHVNYLLWEPGDIAVRIFGDAAIIRYQAQIQIVVGGNPDGGQFWHTDSYEKRDGRWQAVWSQATRIA